MSSNKRMCLRSDSSKKRQSFSERICDNLCQHILQFLSLEDKLRLESVSKQFQRTALISKTSLNVIPIVSEDLEVIKQLLKKFANLNEITFGKTMFCKPVYKQNDLIELIIKYCNHLTRIQIQGNDLQIEEEVQKKFFDKFGKQLISVVLWSEKSWFTFTSAPNIEDLTIESIDSQLSQIKFNRLKRFCVSTLSTKDLHLFELFFENNAKTLKYLDINYKDIEDMDINKNFLQTITKSTNLVHLSINYLGLEFRLFDKSFTNYWKEIAINCKSIKSLKLCFDGYNNEMISVLKEFKRLKRLDLEIFNPPFGGYQNQYVHPFQDIKGLNGLTHFSICFNSVRYAFEETVLKDIDINFPKLKYLKILYPIKATKKTAQVLSRLSSLETIDLWLTNEKIFRQIERQLIQNCNKFKNFNSPEDIHRLMFRHPWDQEEEEEG